MNNFKITYVNQCEEDNKKFPLHNFTNQAQFMFTCVNNER